MLQRLTPSTFHRARPYIGAATALYANSLAPCSSAIRFATASARFPRARRVRAARELIATEGYHPVYGARPPRRYIQREVETQIGRAR
jgi:C-terminal, D2-small domain, of ClpB protein